jgi:acyl-CoA synthetase (AMP-forming)/AMP-acid ligase II
MGLEAGMGHGDRIAVLMPNSVEAAESMCGILKAGGVVVPLSALLTGPDLVRQISEGMDQCAIGQLSASCGRRVPRLTPAEPARQALEARAP